MYVTSLVFLLAAVVTLLLGLRAGGLALVFVSIGCSVTSALFLAVSVLRRRVDEPQAVAVAAAAEAEPESSGFQWKGIPALVAKREAARDDEEVVALPARGTFHRPSCRFVKGKRGVERIARAEAHDRGYSACGVCKPD